MRYTPSILLASTVLLTSPVLEVQGGKQPGEGYLQLLLDAAASEDFWVAVHATEYLIDLGYAEQAEKVCTEYLTPYESSPQQRIGLWRVQYRLELQAAAKQTLLTKLVSAYETTNGPDRIHAAETLAKLRFCFDKLNKRTVRNDLDRNDMLGTFVKWGVSVACQQGLPDDPARLIKLLDATLVERKLAAYGLTFLSKPSARHWQQLAETALRENDEETRAYLLGAAYQLYDSQLNIPSPLFDRVRLALFALADSKLKSVGMELCRALAIRPDPKGQKLLKRLVDMPDTNTDVRATAAYALLKQYANEYNMTKP